MKAIICGGRNFSDKQTLYNVLTKAYKLNIFSELVLGEAPGADYLAKEWAKENNISFTEFKANWEAYGNAAGPIRNRKMLDFGATVVIAFAGGRGTANMISQAKDRDFKEVDTLKEYYNNSFGSLLTICL